VPIQTIVKLGNTPFSTVSASTKFINFSVVLYAKHDGKSTCAPSLICIHFINFVSIIINLNLKLA
jgi:hypothetical protein